jgi:hypothetical protein
VHSDVPADSASSFAQEWEHRIDEGDVAAALASSDHVLEGDAKMGGQVTCCNLRSLGISGCVCLCASPPSAWQMVAVGWCALPCILPQN